MALPRASLALTLLLLSLPVALGACGDGASAPVLGPRVRVIVFSVDGERPEGLVARAVDRPNATETYPLVAVDGGEDGEFLIPGAPPGSYKIEGPGGWASLQAGRMPPRLDEGQPPILFQLGHPRTLYILPAATDARAGPRWGAWRIGDGGETFEPIDVEVLREPPGYITALRFPADAWHGDLEVAGDVLRSVPGNAGVETARGPLAQPYRFQARPNQEPLVIALQFAPTAPLTIALVPADGVLRPDGTGIRVDVSSLPVSFGERGEVVQGTARFARIPSVDRPLRLFVGEDAQPLTIQTEVWRQSPRLYVLDAAGAPRRKLEVELSEPLDVFQAVARTRTSEAFGMVPFESRGTRGTLYLPSEVEEVFLDARTAWARLDRQALASKAPTAVFEKGFLYQGKVQGNVQDARVRLYRQDDDRAFSGQAFEFPVLQEGVFTGRLPLGRYLVEVVSPRGVRKREQPLVAEEPRQFHVRLDAP